MSAAGRPLQTYITKEIEDQNMKCLPSKILRADGLAGLELQSVDPSTELLHDTLTENCRALVIWSRFLKLLIALVFLISPIVRQFSYDIFWI
jgi:hypothetical protein